VRKNWAVGRLLGGLAAIVAWVGWLTVCPALGFPTLATAAMFNRVLVPREDPGSWLGWGLLLIGLAAAALLYVVAADRGRLRPSLASGISYGAICWLVAGAIVMPLLGLAVPAAPSATPAPAPPPDPMQGSFMMLHLGPGAPIAALVAWLMFGALLGGTSRLSLWSRPVRPQVRAFAGGINDPGWRRALALAGGVAVVVVLVSAAVIASLRIVPTRPSVTSAKTLATGPVEALPPGTDFVSVIKLDQTPGATLGPHAHVAGFAYALKGVETLQFSDGRSIRVAPGEAGFMGTQLAHAHVNADDRVPTATLAVLIVAAASALCLTQTGQPRRAARLAPAALAVLIAASLFGAWNPWSNEWLFLAVRPAAARGAPMPLPAASRLYESPDVGALPPGPYMETLQEITVAPSAVPFDVDSTGAAVLLVLDGRVRIELTDGSSEIGAGGAMLVPTDSFVRITDAGEGPAHVLNFGVAPTL
jgi:quercetin dioxygenase-like cupin family protein